MNDKLDHLFGHTIERGDSGTAWVYQDDGTAVDWDSPRRCKGCRANIALGTHDPCISKLPGTRQACCGHGLELTPNGNAAGYVALKDGRTIRFKGLPGPAIRELVESLLAGNPLPDGVTQDADRSWWAGLTDAQFDYVWSRLSTPADIQDLVREALANA